MKEFEKSEYLEEATRRIERLKQELRLGETRRAITLVKPDEHLPNVR